VGPDEVREMVTVARRHYLDGASRVDIAEELGISRFRVGRLLQRALETGVVQIHVRAPSDLDIDLSEKIRLRYGLRRALAVQTPDEEAVHDALGRVASDLLSEIITSDDVLGIDCGRTLRAMTAHLHDLAACDVVQLTGMAGTVGETSVDITRKVAEINGGRVFPVFAPIVVPDARTAAVLKDQPSIRSAMSRYPDVTKAVVAIGAWDPRLSQAYQLLNEQEQEHFARAGVVGETCALLVDAQGRAVPGLEDRRIGVTAAELRAIPDVIGVAGGSGKALAIHAVLSSGVLDSIVTDVHVARRLLAS
jgi:DNA-binding transcriptional regulator LsrR (DeoR family)